MYSVYVIMYVHGNQLTQTTDHRPQTTDHRRTHFKSLSKIRETLWYKVPTVQFFLCDIICTFHNLPSKIVMYSIYVIMYVHGNQLTQTTDHRPQTTDHRPQTTDHRTQTTDHRPRTTDGHTLNLSRKFEKPSDIRFRQFIFFSATSYVHFATYLLVK